MLFNNIYQRLGGRERSPVFWVSVFDREGDTLWILTDRVRTQILGFI